LEHIVRKTHRTVYKILIYHCITRPATGLRGPIGKYHVTKKTNFRQRP